MFEDSNACVSREEAALVSAVDPEAALRALTSVRRKDYAVGVVLLSLGLLAAQSAMQVGGHAIQETTCCTLHSLPTSSQLQSWIACAF